MTKHHEEVIKKLEATIKESQFQIDELNRPKTLTTTFKSPFMPEDKLTTTGETLDECKQKFFDWWENYGKTKEEAIKTVLWTEVID